MLAFFAPCPKFVRREAPPGVWQGVPDSLAPVPKTVQVRYVNLFLPERGGERLAGHSGPQGP
eukprot:13497270-Alexandrium_andersonii.AAC.1